MLNAKKAFAWEMNCILYCFWVALVGAGRCALLLVFARKTAAKMKAEDEEKAKRKRRYQELVQSG